MSCKAFQKLIPLYVEEDLRPRQMARVRTHLSSCHDCWQLVDGYRASQRWLRSWRGPLIDGSALEALRRQIERHVDAAPARSPLWMALERRWAFLRQWASQPGVSVAAVFLVVLGSVALSRVIGPVTEAPGATGLVTTLDESGGDDSGGGDEGEESAAAERDPGQAAGGDEGADGSEGTVASAPDELNGDDALRIEIQTRDPNVRIIWFTPPETPGAVEN